MSAEKRRSGGCRTIPDVRAPFPLAPCAIVIALLALTACGQPTQSRAPTAERSPSPAVSEHVPTVPPDTPAASTTEPVASPDQPRPSTSPGSPVATAPASEAPSDPAAVALEFERFATGLDALTLVTHAGDGSGLVYAVEQRGLIVVVEPDGTVREPPFLDIRVRIRSGGERGLLGLAFHPDFATNGRLYVDYTDTAGDTVVSEFTADLTADPASRTADPGSERVILTVDQPYANHNGGMVAFGPDGYLYISLGDGGGGGDPDGHGQNRGTLLGSILRIDVDAQQPYAIPPDNPLVEDAAARPEIWAWGLRNPWRFSFDRVTGALFIGDVGQGAWEEIDAEPAGTGGRNYGWNIMEGPECYRQAACDTSGLVAPVAAYERAGDRCAVTGGYVYRGERFPALRGAYLFSDYCSGEVWGLDPAVALADGRAEPVVLGRSGINPGGFGEDEAGELYLAGQAGEILRIVVAEP